MMTSTELQRYKEFKPTQFDSKGLFLPDQSEWVVVPVGQNRDSGPLGLSNFNKALELLGGESETVEVHRFGHWACGWFEIIIVNPNDKERVTEAETIAKQLEDYPVLDESDFSEREFNEYIESWDQYGADEFREALKEYTRLELSDDIIDEIPNDELMTMYESWIPSGEYYIGEDSGVSINIDSAKRNADRNDIAKLIWTHRNK